MLNTLPKPIIFAHRGASMYAPENTIEAFQLALQQGAEAIELDAKLTQDGEIVVIHDQTLERTTSGAGKVREYTLEQIRQLDAGSFFDLSFHHARVPALEEVLETFGKKIYINIELTNYASIYDELPEKVAALIQKMGLEDYVLCSSFNPIALQRIKRLLPQIPIGLLTMRGSFGALARSLFTKTISFQSLHPEKSDVTYKLLNTWQKRNKKIFVYTVNEASEMEKLFRMGVDGIFTDDPLKALEIRAAVIGKG